MGDYFVRTVFGTEFEFERLCWFNEGSRCKESTHVCNGTLMLQ